MSKIRILIPIHTLPNIESVTTLELKNLLSFLKTKIEIEIIWFVYTPTKLKLNEKFDSDTLVDIHNFKNAVEVIKKLKPDLIYSSPYVSFIDNSFSSTAEKFNIPVFCILHARDPFVTKKTTAKTIQSNFTRFFETSIPTDHKNEKKIFLKRGRFFIYKYLFLLKTKLNLKTSIFDTIFIIWKYILTDTNNSKYGKNIFQFLENSELFDIQIQSGFNKSNLIISGNPMYDKLFKKFSQNKITKNNFTDVLFVPSTLYEHGFWTLKQRDFVLTEIITNILQDSTFNLSVKIHPSSSNFNDYESIIHSINPLIPISQKGSIEEFLQDIDVVISSQSSTAEVYALLANKRIVICDFFNSDYEDLFVKQGIAVSCKNPSDIISSIKKAKTLQSYEENRKKFINNFLFKWDGKSSERISKYLIEILENHKSNL